MPRTTREEKKPRIAAFFMPGSNRSRRQRAKKTSRLTCIVTGCRNGPIEFPITWSPSETRSLRLAVTMCRPQMTSAAVSETFDTNVRIAGGNVVRVEDLLHTVVICHRHTISVVDFRQVSLIFDTGKRSLLRPR